MVLDQRWGVRAGMTLGARRFLRALGLTMAPLLALSLSQGRNGAAGALGAAAAACLPLLLAPLVLAAPRARRPEPADAREQPDKYERLKEMAWRLGPRRESEADARTEISDDGGSVSEQPAPAPAPPSNPGPHAVTAPEAARTTVVAEVHCDVAGERQQPGPVLTLSPEATARLGGGGAASAPNGGAYAAPGAEAGAPRPLFGEDGQAWNIAYSFDCDGDDDIELFVRRQSPRRGALARCCAALGPHARGCRADLRPVRRPAFHLALFTVTCCRLAGLALTVLLPSLALVQMGARAKAHLAAALPAVSGVGAMLFGLAVLWETSWESPSDSGTPVRTRRRLLSAVSAVAASGFLLLSWGHSRWWLMLGSLTAGFGTAGAVWAQRFATREALGGAANYRAQPLLSVLTGLAVVLLAALCGEYLILF
ncbi:hypothetical protein FOCC_FOCC003847 [Frankliniella occidentalis]|nr:hypothetical protein FOCC_FOCC003847 [Frankliniella occidentalis]